MMYYKLTDEDMRTRGTFQWQFDKWFSIEQHKRDRHKELCSNGWFHCYDDPLLALLFNPIHANISMPRLFKVNVKGTRRVSFGEKYGFTFMRIPSGSEIELPGITTNQRIAFGILCAKEVYKDRDWNEWADRWLGGTDRSAWAAAAARAAARAADADAARDAAWAAAKAAAAAWAADAGWAAAKAAAIDLKTIAKKAMKY
jgi:hypothetical protein